MMMQERPYLSIGEVLGLLLEEFPDVTISKIRFLESQGLIDPERTASGYRKFYDNDVDLLRVILREQRENFLPLRVIRDRLESGAIEDPTGPTAAPSPGTGEADIVEQLGTDDHHDLEPSAVVPLPATAKPVVATVSDHRHDNFGAGELCQLADLTAEQLAELESYGLLAGKGSGASTVYTTSDLDIARAAAGFMKHGVGGRHLRAWRQAADREASLFEQMILPLLRQRNPQARQQAVATLAALATLGGELRSAIVHSALSHHFDG